MSPNIHILLPLAGTLVGLGLALALVRVRSLSAAGYSRETYRAIEGMDLKTGLLLTMVAFLFIASVPLIASLMPVKEKKTGPIPITPWLPRVPVFPQPPSIDPNRGSTVPQVPGIAHAPTIGVPKPVEDSLARSEDDITARDAVDLYGSVNATPDSIIALMAKGDLDVPPAPGEFVSYDREPKAIRVPRPVYPDICLKAGIEGTTFVQILINKKGDVVRAVVHKSSGNPALDEAALAAASGASFTPAMQGNDPVSVWISLPFTFKMSD